MISTAKAARPSGRARRVALMGVAALALAAGVPSLANAASYPRNETLYTGGTQWGNIAGFNPMVGGAHATGLIGLVNETLFRYDPLKDTYLPWLAEKGEWTADNVYTLTISKGVKWSDGSAFTAADVKWNLDLGQYDTIPFHNLYTGIKSVEASGNTVTVTFDGTPKYQEWQNQIWNIPMSKPSVWKGHENAKDLASWSPDNPIGTGPYVLDKAGYDPTTRVVYKKRDNWWAVDAGLQPSPAPKYIIDLVNSSNNTALGLVLTGQEDLNNNYLPGVSKLIAGGYGLQTYYPQPPYMLAANTAWLVPNTTKAPMNDVNFRKALAASINVDQIVSVDYGDMVAKANSTGLLPIWDKWVDKDAVAKYGFKYDPAAAKKILTDAGYKLGADGMFTQPDGSPINLKVAVPNGWSDWMQAIQMISADAKAAGINITPDYPDYNAWQQARNSGTFDLVIDNSAQMSDTPFTYYQYMYTLPILQNQTNFNFQRFEDKDAWDLVQKLDSTKKDDTAGMQAILTQLETKSMQDLPEIPLWYNGVWSQAGTTTWTNWPSSTTADNYIPAMWNGYLQMTGIDVITHVKPAGK